MLEEQLGDQFGCLRSPPDDQNAQNEGEPSTPLSACRAFVRWLPCILIIEKAALAADLITGLICKHLEQHLISKTHRKVHLSEFGRARRKLVNPHLEQKLAGAAFRF